MCTILEKVYSIWPLESPLIKFPQFNMILDGKSVISPCFPAGHRVMFDIFRYHVEFINPSANNSSNISLW